MHRRTNGVRDVLSPNHDARPSEARVDMVILHYTGMSSAAAAIDRLRDPFAAVSCHYLIDEDGCVLRLVPEGRRAWHAGVSGWCGRHRLNDCSVGIELVNPGHDWGYRSFPQAQMQSLLTLLAEIVERHGVAIDRVLGHSDVAPARKLDPGELFDWRRLAAADLAVWPTGANDREPGHDLACKQLASIGYPFDLPVTTPKSVIRAFQRRFRPAQVDGLVDQETMGLIQAVVATTA